MEKMHANPEVQAAAEKALAAGVPLDTIKALLGLLLSNLPAVIAFIKAVADALHPPAPTPTPVSGGGN